MTPQEEAERYARHFEIMADAKVKLLGRSEVFGDVPESTEVLFFDYGGVSGGYGPNPFWDRVREIKQWAEDHPSALVLIGSSFTWDHGGFIAPAWNADLAAEHVPPPRNLLPLHDYRKRANGRSEWDDIRAWLGLPAPPEAE